MHIFLILGSVILSFFIIRQFVLSRSPQPFIVWLSYKMLKLRMPGRSRALLKRVKNPDDLGPTYQAWYYFVQGICEQHRKNYPEARSSLDRALEFGKFSENDNSLTHFSLSQIAILEKDNEQARVHLKMAMDTPHKSIMDGIYLRAWNDLSQTKDLNK